MNETVQALQLTVAPWAAPRRRRLHQAREALAISVAGPRVGAVEVAFVPAEHSAAERVGRKAL